MKNTRNNLSTEILKQLNTFHTYNKPYDDDLDAWLHQAYANKIKAGKQVNWRTTYFSPSSANMCPRALYHKLKKDRKDAETWAPHQRRWVHLGEKVGDMIQEEFLLMMKHYEKFTGTKPRFTMQLLNDGNGGMMPAFEQFIFKQHIIEHNGEKFSILGTSDGILVDNETKQRIGLEVKSKQETPSKTSLKVMKEAKEDHIRQCVCYSIMYELDKYVIAYVNTAKKKWNATDDEMYDTPDIRLFDVNVSEEEKNDVLDYFAEITKCARLNTPPLPDLTKWMFNPYKNAIANSITDDELERLQIVLSIDNPNDSFFDKKNRQQGFEDLVRRKRIIDNAKRGA